MFSPMRHLIQSSLNSRPPARWRAARSLAGWLGLSLLPVMAADSVLQTRVVTQLPTAPANTHYVGHRPPLLPAPLLKLPVGAVRPEGWLRRVLRLQGDGFHGHLTEISQFLKKENNAWLSPTGRGERGWEEVPYWLKGFQDCGYLLEDERMIGEARIWIEGALGSQQPDGWFGPGEERTGVATDLKGRDDLWPNMIMLFCLQSFYERTGDRRVIELMTRYFKYLATVPEERFLVGYWPKMRAGDQLYSLFWLYNRTGEPWLLDLAHKTHRHAARWDTGIINWHNVNLAQGFREPATYWLLSHDPNHLAATERIWTELRPLYDFVDIGEADLLIAIPAACSAATKTAARASPARARPLRPAASPRKCSRMKSSWD